MDLKEYSSRKIRESEYFLKHAKKDWLYHKIDRYLIHWAKVLDIWCGPATFNEYWKHKHIKYCGIDNNPWFVNHAVSKNLDVKCCDISKENVPFEDNSFDFIYCRHVIEHLPVEWQIKLFSEANRLLKKWWIFMCLWPTAYHWYFWDDPTHYRPCTHGQFLHLAGDFDFDIIENKYSLLRNFSNGLQRWLRLPPLRFFLWEVYLVAKKK